jgi:hypothetical protein
MPGANGRLRCVAVATALLASLAATAASGAGAAPAGQRKLVLYSVATASQYVNNKDDRERGQGANPFGNFHDASATTKQAKGPFPGDESMFQFAIYAKPSLGAKIGSAQFACLYNFNHNVFCDVSYKLQGGTIAGSGTFNLDAPKFTLAVTGGSGKYSNLRGDLEVAPAAHHAERLSFTLG